MIKFKPREVNVIDKNRVIMVVGETPGRPKKNSTNEYVWMEQRAGSFLRKLVKDCQNLILTNSYNYYCITQEERTKAQAIGKIELIALIEQYKPVKIVALGNYAYDTLMSLQVKLNVIKMYHPSFILRFAYDTSKYKRKLLELLTT